MKTIILAIQTKLAGIPALKHVDKEWGQLNFDPPPVKFPCALIDFGNIAYSQLGKLAQRAEATVEILVADIRLNNSSFQAPDKAKSYSTIELIETIQENLQGYRPGNAQALIRTGLTRLYADSTREVYKVTYTTAFTVTPPVATHNVDTPTIDINTDIV